MLRMVNLCMVYLEGILCASQIHAEFKSLTKLRNFVAETSSRTQMFPSLAVTDANLASWTRKIFLNQLKNVFASRTQICLAKRMSPS